ncbi:hypothetical protein D3C78_949760 [compost metagenome]
MNSRMKLAFCTMLSPPSPSSTQSDSLRRLPDTSLISSGLTNDSQPWRVKIAGTASEAYSKERPGIGTRSLRVKAGNWRLDSSCRRRYSRSTSELEIMNDFRLWRVSLISCSLRGRDGAWPCLSKCTYTAAFCSMTSLLTAALPWVDAVQA